MAARKRLGPLNDKWREKISAGLLVHRLREHGLSEIIEKPTYRWDHVTKKRVRCGIRLAPKVEMQDSQIKACSILLAKVAPDLQRTTFEGGDADKPMISHATHKLDAPSIAALKKLLENDL